MSQGHDNRYAYYTNMLGKLFCYKDMIIYYPRILKKETNIIIIGNTISYFS